MYIVHVFDIYSPKLYYPPWRSIALSCVNNYTRIKLFCESTAEYYYILLYNT